MRGSTAVATAARPAATKGENDGSGPSVRMQASTRAPAASPAPMRSGMRGGRRPSSCSSEPGSGPSAGSPPRERPKSVAPPARRRGQPDPAQRGRLDEAALVRELGLDGTQLRPQARRIRAEGGIDVERVVDHVAEPDRKVAPHRGERRQRAPEPARGRGGPGRLHRVRAGPGLVEGQRKRVDVARGRHAGALGLLRSHVGERADDVSGARQRIVSRHVGHAEVGELGEARAGGRLGQHHHVPGLHVAVDHAARVRMLERLAERDPDARHVAVGDRSGLRQLSEGSPPNQLRDQIDVVLVGGQLVDADDPRVVQPRGRPGLALHALAGAALARDHLDGHLALQLLVPGEPYNPEPSRSQPALHPVAAQDEARPRSTRKRLCRVRPSQGKRARLVREASFGTSHASFVFVFG